MFVIYSIRICNPCIFGQKSSFSQQSQAMCLYSCLICHNTSNINVVYFIRHGNLLKLTEALQANEQFFIKSGVYLILEKLKIITYRNLFKKV